MIKIFKIVTKLGEIVEKNSLIEKKFKLKKNSLEKLTGIKKRYISSKHQTSEKNAVGVCKKIPKNELFSITHIISVTNTPSVKFPGISNFVSSELNLENVHCINLNSGCTGYVDALSIAHDVIASNKKSKILIITSDTYSKFINPNNKSIRSLFSDGATASLVKYSLNGYRSIIRKNKNIKNTQKDLFFFDKEITMDGPAVVSFAINHVIPELKKFQNKSNSIFIHQAGNIVYNQVKNSLNQKTFLPKNYQKYGNLVSGSIPFLIKDNFKKFNNLKDVIICGFGVGLSLSLIVLKK